MCHQNFQKDSTWYEVKREIGSTISESSRDFYLINY